MNWGAITVVVGLVALGFATAPHGLLLVLGALAWLVWKS